MATTVEGICAALERSQVMAADDVAALRKRWFRSTREGVADVERFKKWLVSNHFVTGYQASMLANGEAEKLCLNQYKLIDRIGKGSLVGLYKAIDGKGQPVLIRIVPPWKLPNPEALNRFEQAAQLALRVQHPNVVRTIDYSQAHGMRYVVLEPLVGESVDDTLKRRGTLPPIQAARIIAHALLGLQQIYELEAVHGDLRPDNVMLVGGPSGGRHETGHQKTVKLLDVGLGRQWFEEGSASPDGDIALLPVTGELQVTGEALDYTAPERASSPQSAGIGADIYSLGCILYHMLAGQPPFANISIFRRDVDLPRPLSYYVPDIPDMLQQIVDQMIAFKEEERYRIPAQAAKAVRVFLASEEEPQPKQEEVATPSPRAVWPAGNVEGSADGKGKAGSLWNELKPRERDFIYVGLGAMLMVILGGMLAPLVGSNFWYFAFFLIAALVGPLIARLAQRSRQKPAQAT